MWIKSIINNSKETINLAKIKSIKVLNIKKNATYEKCNAK